MNGAAPDRKIGLPSPGAGWQLLSVDHFASNGLPDLLFQNTNGALLMAPVIGNTVGFVSPPTPGADWQSVNGHPFAAG